MWRSVFSKDPLGLIQGKVVIDRSTKDLVKRIKPGEIAFLDHRDLDEVAARGLVEKRVGGILNASRTMSGLYPSPGPEILLNAGIPILDDIGDHALERLRDGITVWIKDDWFGYWGPHGEEIPVGKGYRLTSKRLALLMKYAHSNFEFALEQFIDNTLTYAVKEKDFVTKSPPFPLLRTKIKGRHVVVVVRGGNYKADLQAIRSYIRDYRPVLIGVDGGADALLENHLTPDVIVGDMDSVSDEALQSGAEIVVHAYPNGEAPGLERPKRLGIKGLHAVPSVGTSEDVAMLLAFEKKAKLIVALGTHSNMVDFMEKGRKGMASTILVRMKIGTKLIDAKGVSILYQGRYRGKELSLLAVSACFPLVALFSINPDFRHLLHLLWVNVRLIIS